ncbi:unnamed protein product [Rotaria socialis]|uniref:RanBP2-type domain-containing protein n=1 Tax=Rotaria socialis TaxID=392032 RepID=A0A819B2I2_9BILA|nr:unnamed protein product [Rotaria socialis]
MTDRKAKRSRVILNDGTWDCSLCTYKNPCVAFRCEMCDSRKGTATRKPKLVLSGHVEQLPRSKRKTDDDYSSDPSTTDDTDGQDDDDDDDEEFQHEERKNIHSNNNNNNHTRRSFPNDHFNESISSPASSTTTTRSYRSASPSSSSKINDPSKISTTKKRPTIGSLSRSTKSISIPITNKKPNHENDQKKIIKHQSSKSKDPKQRQSNDNNQKIKVTSNERNKKNDVQKKKKKIKLSSLSSMSSSSSTSSNSSSTHTTTTITVDGVSVRITELVNNKNDSLTTNDTFNNGNNPSRASSSSPADQSRSYNNDQISLSSSLIGSIDETVDPCENFYEFVCGTQLKNTKIPNDANSQDIFVTLETRLQDAIIGREYVNHAFPLIVLLFADLLTLSTSNNTNIPKAVLNAQRLFASCVNETAIMADSVNVLLSFVNTELGGWPILQGPMWDDATFNFSQLLLKLAEYSSDVIYIAGTEIDEMNSSVQAIRIGQSDLGLLDRSYYVNESDVTKAYRQFIQNFALALATDRSMINNDVNDIFNFEKTIATFDFVRHLRRLYLLANVSLVDTDVVIASELDYLRNVSLIVDQQSPRVLQNYMVWRFMMSRAWIIPRRFRTIKQQFDQVFLGTTVEQVRAMKCARYVNYNMGFAVSKLYIDKYFDKDARIESIVMIDNIRNQFIDIINQSTWMNSISKSRAIDKARAINAKVGYPAYLDDNNNTKLEKNYAEYNFNSSFARNVLLMLKLNAKKNLQVLRQLLDREEWIGYTPTIVNAFYNPSFNDISFPAGILQTPFFYKDAPKYLNYGAIGTIIGHEITHGFDNFGGLYDKDGNKILWWDNETLSAFNQRKTCIIDQYNNYTVTQIDLPVNGEQTQGENIADNGGLKAAFARIGAHRVTQTPLSGTYRPAHEATHLQIASRSAILL